MKHWLTPLLVLLLLFTASMANAHYVARSVEDWCSGLELSLSAAEAGDWTQTRAALQSVYASWNEKQTYFHIMIDHDALNAAESLFAVSRRFAAAEESAEFCANTADLFTQLALLREMEEISIRNIL